jgi:23S rRNA (adenine2503-C2)-methyltransferase
MKKLNLKGMNEDELETFVQSVGEKKYRAAQLYAWLYAKHADTFDEMSNISKEFRDLLKQTATIEQIQLIASNSSQKDGTTKFLFRLSDGLLIESVLIPPEKDSPSADQRLTLCLSTQVGCPLDCKFCASGTMGFTRDLSASEILDQVIQSQRNSRRRITNIVYMGMGEPMLNYDALWQAIEMLNSPDGFGLGARNMTVSTAGLIPEIKRLSGEKLQVGLAISLHAATDELRGQLVPINRKYSIKPLIAACKEYFEKTGRRLSFEYILFEGINDSPKDARALAHVVQGLNCYVNLIPANPTRERQYRPPTQETVLAFEAELKRLHINCTLRSRKGVDIDAGCGQLRSRLLKPAPPSRKGKS